LAAVRFYAEGLCRVFCCRSSTTGTLFPRWLELAAIRSQVLRTVFSIKAPWDGEIRAESTGDVSDHVSAWLFEPQPTTALAASTAQAGSLSSTSARAVSGTPASIGNLGRIFTAVFGLRAGPSSDRGLCHSTETPRCPRLLMNASTLASSDSRKSRKLTPLHLHVSQTLKRTR
jgi:hypothetical protein